MVQNKKKKVGILTFHYSNNNFGAVVQAYAISQLIASLGHEPYIINFKRKEKNADLKVKLFTFLQTITGFRFSKFRKKHLPNILDEVKTEEDFVKLNQFLDVFTVGSDQVWRHWNDPKTLRRYFLDFVDENKPKIAVAASFGLETWNESERLTNEVKSLIEKFKAISVREESGIDICRQVFDTESVRILDPTMLIAQHKFHELADQSTLSNKNDQRYLAYMLLDDAEKTESFLKNLAKKNNLQFIKIKGKKIIRKPELMWFNSIYNWLDYLRKSEFIVTDSFHCVVFSLIFRKKFICLANENRGVTRLKNILTLIGEEKRFFTKLNQSAIEKRFMEEIDYEKVWSILDREKQTSLDFLKQNLDT